VLERPGLEAGRRGDRAFVPANPVMLPLERRLAAGRLPHAASNSN